jgi:peptidoglycan/xylan/chitin deacetylase (PgdA/CDA1 family)
VYLHYYNWVFEFLFPNRTWKKEVEEKVIYLTFDDGPVPVVTEFVLDELAKVNAKATFFCVGDNILKYPFVYHRLLNEGHRSANHTFNHLKGVLYTTQEFVDNIDKCDAYIQDQRKDLRLFRPPYGRMTRRQVKSLQNKYEIVMWSVLSGDFDSKLSKDKCLSKTINHTQQGSIVVFHDSVKTFTKLRWVLPRYLAHFTQLGYRFECL